MKPLQLPLFSSPRPAGEVHRKKYNIIYADPPWRYRRKAQPPKPWMAEAHYPTLSTQSICDLPVADIAADDSTLFLWATFPRIFEAQRVIRSWGFQYCTVAFVWIKAANPKFPKHWVIDPDRYPFPVHWGMGSWTSSNCEVCLIATKGQPKRMQHGIHQLIYAPVGRHSAKPPVVRERITQLAGSLPRIELFARTQAEGWDAWGNQVKSDINLIPHG